MNSVLAIGGAGYIGSHAVKALAAARQRAVVFDDFSLGHREATRFVRRNASLVRDQEPDHRQFEHFPARVSEPRVQRLIEADAAVTPPF